MSKCTRCGRCCICLPWDINFLKEHEKYAGVDFVTYPHGVDTVMVDTHDTRCPFWHRATGLCLIYPMRPPICKAFGPESKNPMLRCGGKYDDMHPHELAKLIASHNKGKTMEQVAKELLE